MKNNIPSIYDRNKQLEIIRESRMEYAPLEGYELGSLIGGREISAPDRQAAFVSAGALSWRVHERYARFSYPVFTVVTTRLRLLVSAKKSIVPQKNFEDQLKSEIDHYKQIYEEFKDERSTEARNLVTDALAQLKKRLPLLKTDLSNFYNCFDRQRREIREKRNADVTYLFNFLNKPNIHEDWVVMMTKTIWDYLVHMEGYIYKIPTLARAVGGSGVYSQLVSLKAPTIEPIVGDRVLSLQGYKQRYYSLTSSAPSVFFQPDEMMRFQYLPSNSFLYSLSPIEAIFRLLNEQLYYDKGRNEEFDLGKPPLGALTIDGRLAKTPEGTEVMNPLTENQRSRAENVLNRRSKIDRIKVIQGVGRSQYHQFMRPERDSLGLERQEKIMDIAAKVYNMTPQEVNLIKDVNRSTAGQQARSEALKGVRPHLDLIANEFYYDLFVPMGFANYSLKFEDEVDESVWTRTESMLKIMGENEVRRTVGMDEYPEEAFDRPPSYRQEQIAGSEKESME